MEIFINPINPIINPIIITLLSFLTLLIPPTLPSFTDFLHLYENNPSINIII